MRTRCRRWRTRPRGDPAPGRPLYDLCPEPRRVRRSASPGAPQQFIREVRDGGGQIVCHSTVSPVVPDDFPAAMCRGFVDAYGLPQAAREAIELGVGHIVEVPDPTRTGASAHGGLQQ